MTIKWAKGWECGRSIGAQKFGIEDNRGMRSVLIGVCIAEQVTGHVIELVLISRCCGIENISNPMKETIKMWNTPLSIRDLIGMVINIFIDIVGAKYVQ